MIHAWPLFHQQLTDGRRAIAAAGAFIRTAIMLIGSGDDRAISPPPLAALAGGGWGGGVLHSAPSPPPQGPQGEGEKIEIGAHRCPKLDSAWAIG